MVLSEQVATDLFGTGQAVGRQVVMDFITFTVCGVVRDVPSSLMSSYAQVWIPYSSNEALTRVNGEYGENMAGYFSVALLARSSSDFDAIRSELDQQVRRYNDSTTAFQKVDWPTFLAGSGAFLFFLLLVPALNLTGVIQSSVQKRKEEIGLRKAFGATGQNLLMQILSENFVLTLIGGVIGIGLSMVLLVVGKPFMLSENVSLTAPMLVKPGLFISALIFTFLLNILSAGIPAWRTTRQPIVEALKGNE